MIGSHVCDSLLANGHLVMGADDLSGGFANNIPPKMKFRKGDICESEEIDSLFRVWRPDFVVHAAAYAAEGLSHFIRRYNYQTNILGSMSLINAAVRHEVKGFVFLSSIATYGHQEPPFTESTPLAPADPYAIAKMAVELDLKAAHEMFGLPYIIFRPFNVYGPRQNIGDNYRNVVGIFMNECLKKKPMTIFGDGKQTRAFSHISDVAPAIAKSIDMPECWGETFNIGGARRYTVNQLAGAVAKAMDVEKKVIHLPARKEAVHASSDQSKAIEFFGKLMPQVPLPDGLKDMASWVRKHGARTTPKFANIEITKNLPPSWAKL
jgi:UDP-glucose 4-epimerase